MKKLLIYSFTALTALSLMVSCRKSDNPKLPTLTRVPEPQFTKDPTTNQVITDPDAFSAKFTLSLFFASDAPPQKMDIMIEKNGDPAQVKLLQANVTTFPTTVTLTSAILKSLYGVASVPGDNYDIGATITTTNGTVIPAFSPLTGAASYDPGVLQQGTTGPTNLPVPAPSISYTALCKFTMTDYGAIGSTVPFKVVSDGWADYTPGTPIPVKIIDATHLSFFYGADINPKPIVITINPADNSTSVASTQFGSYSSLPPSYGVFTTVSVTDAKNNAVFPCQLTVGVDLAFTSPAGNFGTGVIVLQKQ